ncbi:MAG: ribonuclease E inhibitor RraB [Pseudoalteromonas sp.]|uniref:ribonuclease E inhibitor RraB n=1 Tax=unclassified Pseudoalteromonas TaxID=194690 RepID=UPI000C089AE5|nr:MULTISPECIES: ribonuclease E inhibitor RraB [unclassified Pseudoalteromonas]MDP2634352.1 ribonuclease E inhibitor RraB [Pseudoalteromonas sp. 1_MG-2023]PHN89252.1 ribonuclease E inhibitor RraB [Pseudoalteromonas sp. 3D05]TGE84373.1 ribonuclease E inhibitor RraB [Pseudoalteromonas sp. KS88]
MENWREISEDIVSSLLEDGSDPEILYEVEHHFVCEDFVKLEQAALAAFKLGYDVEEPAELELEDGAKIWGFDIVVEAELDVEVIMEDVDKLAQLAIDTGVEYDGWGTYFQE